MIENVNHPSPLVETMVSIYNKNSVPGSPDADYFQFPMMRGRD